MSELHFESLVNSGEKKENKCNRKSSEWADQAADKNKVTDVNRNKDHKSKQA